jgi:YD repeat-containing protein
MRSMLANPRSVAVGHDNIAYIADSDNQRVRKITPPTPESTSSSIIVPSSDGSLVYEFDSSGHHLRTYDAITAVELLSFNYDSSWRITSVRDVNGRFTNIERNADGTPTAITGPDGIRNTLTVNADGWLTKITGPSGDSVSLEYAAGGLLTRVITRQTNRPLTNTTVTVILLQQQAVTRRRQHWSTADPKRHTCC